MDYEGSPLRPELDWDAYFESFMQKHGKAVPYGQRWLFKDGWSYSMLDTSGPEYPPPKNEFQLRELKRVWRETYIQMLEFQLTELQAIVFDLEELQSIRNMPLQVATLSIGENDEYLVINNPLKLDGLKARADQLRRELSDLHKSSIDEEESDHEHNGKRPAQSGHPSVHE